MNPVIPHPDPAQLSICGAVITVSDTRTVETDNSGQLIQMLLQSSGHHLQEYQVLKDDPVAIRATVLNLCQQSEIQVIITNGGTGIAPRDTTYDAITGILEKTLPGFGELFRSLSFAEIGSRAIASRAVAGVCQGKLIFSLPGSSSAVRLAMERLILPELIHLVTQLRQ